MQGNFRIILLPDELRIIEKGKIVFLIKTFVVYFTLIGLFTYRDMQSSKAKLFDVLTDKSGLFLLSLGCLGILISIYISTRFANMHIVKLMGRQVELNKCQYLLDANTDFIKIDHTPTTKGMPRFRVSISVGKKRIVVATMLYKEDQVKLVTVLADFLQLRVV